MVLLCGPTINKTYWASVKLSTKLYQKYRANYKCPLYIDEVRVSERPIWYYGFERKTIWIMDIYGIIFD